VPAIARDGMISPVQYQCLMNVDLAFVPHMLVFMRAVYAPMEMVVDVLGIAVRMFVAVFMFMFVRVLVLVFVHVRHIPVRVWMDMDV